MDLIVFNLSGASISVVIATKGRLDLLRETIEVFGTQTLGRRMGRRPLCGLRRRSSGNAGRALA
jgi:hypothetical protein